MMFVRARIASAIGAVPSGQSTGSVFAFEDDEMRLA